MVKLHTYNRDGKYIISGTIKEVRPGTGAGEGRVCNVKIEGAVWDQATQKQHPETLDIAFWNSDAANRADDALSKLEVGKFASIMATKSEDGKFTGLYTKKNGKWTFAETIDENGNVYAETNIFIGWVTSVSPYENKTGISIPISIPDNEGNFNTEWIQIYIWNNERNPKIAQNAAMLLTPKEVEGSEQKLRKRIIIRCSDRKVYTTADGTEKSSYYGYAFEII